MRVSRLSERVNQVVAKLSLPPIGISSDAYHDSANSSDGSNYACRGAPFTLDIGDAGVNSEKPESGVSVHVGKTGN